jgi:AAA family ATP:ADP antiporter
MLMAWLFTGLTQGLGLGLAAVAVVGAGIAALWSLVGIYLGRWFERDDLEPNTTTVDAPSVARESTQ